MIASAVAFLVYAITCTELLARRRWRAISTSTFVLMAWFLCAFVLKLLLIN